MKIFIFQFRTKKVKLRGKEVERGSNWEEEEEGWSAAPRLRG